MQQRKCPSSGRRCEAGTRCRRIQSWWCEWLWMRVGRGHSGQRWQETTLEGTSCCDQEFGQIPWNSKKGSVVIRITCCQITLPTDRQTDWWRGKKTGSEWAAAEGQGRASGRGRERYWSSRSTGSEKQLWADARSPELYSAVLKLCVRLRVTNRRLKQAWSKLRAAVSGKHMPGSTDLGRKGDYKSHQLWTGYMLKW